MSFIRIMSKKRDDIIIKKIVNSGLKYKFIGISALKTDKLLDIDNIISYNQKLMRQYKIKIQLLNADKVATWEHLFFSAISALKSFEGKYNLAENLPVELLLYVSANRQINLAIDNFGLSPNIKHIAVVIFAERLNFIEKGFEKIKAFLSSEEDIKLLDIDDDKFKILQDSFAITQEEINNLADNESFKSKIDTLVKIIIDRGAMVALES